MVDQADHRRRMLLGASALCALPSVALAGQTAVLDLQRADQRFRLDVSTKQGYQTAAWLLRDIKANNQMAWPSMNLLLWASYLQQALAVMHRYTVFEITSGLRTPATNQSTEGAAQQSRHLPDQNNRFYAMDIKPLGASLDQLVSLADQTTQGGIGRYESHLHLDVRQHAARWQKP